jgi:hypothetical protein
LPWLAQFAGVRLTPGASEQQWRDEIIAHASFQRGTLGALQAAGALHLTGTKFVDIFERDGSPYRVTVYTRTAETPDPNQTLRDLLSQTPAGLVLTHVVSNFVPWNEMDIAWDDIPADVTWDQMANYVP